MVHLNLTVLFETSENRSWMNTWDDLDAKFIVVLNAEMQWIVKWEFA